jgi:hypothetical protein
MQKNDIGAVKLIVAQADAFLHAIASAPSVENVDAPLDLSMVQMSCSSFDLLWTALDNGAPTEVVKYLASDLNFDADLENWMTGLTPLQVIDVWADHLEANAEKLTAMDFNIGAIRVGASDLHGLNALYADTQGAPDVAKKLRTEQDCAYDPSRPTVWFSALRRAQGGFTKLAASLGRACTICPFTGAVLSTQHCLAIPHNPTKQVFLFYRFESVHTFYVIVGGFSGSKLFIYIPKTNIVLRLQSPLFEWGHPQHPVEQFTKFVMRNSAAVSDYLHNNTAPAVLTGTMNSLGHFFWNEVSGVVRYADSGYLDNIPVGILYKHAYIDAYRLISEQLLPERLICNTDQEIFDAVLSQRLFCVRPIDYKITADVANRIRYLAEKSATPEQIAAATKARKCDYVLWVGLRSHNKVWLTQVNGLSAVIDRLAGEHQTVAVYVDGMPDCRDHLEELRLRIPPNVELFSGIDVSIYDTIIWAFQIDSYIATIGSGLTTVTWIAGKPGIAHAESHHLNQIKEFWGHVRPDVPLPIIPDFEQVIDLGNLMYCNYEIDDNVMLQLLDRIPKLADAP